MNLLLNIAAFCVCSSWLVHEALQL